MAVRIDLKTVHFGEKERVLADGAGFRVSAFKYDSGIAALRVKNRRGEMIVLPFKGHQIWRLVMDGRDLTMKSMFEEPVANVPYLETYGAFFIHCGATAIGPAEAGDTRGLHGELPNAPYQKGWVEIDEAAGTCAVVGTYEYTVAFSYHYLATSTHVMRADDTLIDVSLNVENLKKTPMDLMYLAHANFRPVDNGELFYTSKQDAKSVRPRLSIPPHITPKPGYPEFLQELAKNPKLHHVLKPELAFDPEVAMMIDMLRDEDGFAHALLKRPDGTADYMRYQPAQCGQCVRWICRTPDQDAIGIAFPATSGVEGFAAEKKKGLYAVVAGGESWRVDMRMGVLSVDETATTIAAIESVNGK
jgi:galactose mutarotase-like enzyme